MRGAHNTDVFKSTEKFENYFPVFEATTFDPSSTTFRKIHVKAVELIATVKKC